ncbi:sigma factor [Leuconostoc miyukkimchii]|uniref:sigma factor n=1 Tax=Leuconostoc miyukkimchii TaxID=910540 RepID=UPI001C7D2B20|nr:sigma factor [Leuconostoc miyukkimchii]
MGKDRLVAVVRAAQNGHEFAYNVLIKHLRGAVYDVHRRKISSRITSDEWYSDGLEVLIKCVRKFDTVKPRAKFSTYFITALTNHATDLVRSYYTAKSEFEKTVLSENNDESGNLFNLGTDTYNPEQLYILRELLHTTDIAKTEEFKKMVRQLLGIESHNSEISSRRFEQMQYRFKKAMKTAISELS